jgi:hypothetical protein
MADLAKALDDMLGDPLVIFDQEDVHAGTPRWRDPG